MTDIVVKTWRKSSFSNGAGGMCVEVAAAGDVVHLRESDRPEATIVTDRARFAAFMAGVKAGEFDDLAG